MNNKPKLANSENRGEEKLLENQQSHFFIWIIIQDKEEEEGEGSAKTVSSKTTKCK